MEKCFKFNINIQYLAMSLFALVVHDTPLCFRRLIINYIFNNHFPGLFSTHNYFVRTIVNLHKHFMNRILNHIF